MANYLITGSSRGLGLALASGLAALPASQTGTIFATARQDNSPQLRDLIDKSAGRVGYVQLDVSNSQSIQEAVKSVESRLQGKGLDVLINNAGIMPITGGVEAMDKLNETFDMNVTNVHNVTRAFLPLLRKSQKKTVVNISTTMGSIGLASTFAPLPVPEYKISKAALNMLTVQYAQAFAKDGFTIFSISPGWLQTDLGGSRADLPVQTGADAILSKVLNATPEQNGEFLNIHVPGWENNPGLNQYDGKNPPW